MTVRRGKPRAWRTPCHALVGLRWEFDYTAVPERLRLVVRAVDGDGVPQIMTPRDPLPEGATGYHIRPIRVERRT